MVRDRIGNSLKSATLLGKSLSGAVQRQDAVGRQDPDDLYRFRLSSSSHLEVQLANQGKGSRTGLQVFALKSTRGSAIGSIGRKAFSSLKRKDFRSLLTPLGRTVAQNRQSRSLNLTLDAGEYYVRVFHHKGATSPYRLNLVASPMTEPGIVSPVAPAPASPPSPTSPGSPASPTSPPSPVIPPPLPSSSSWQRQFGTSGNDYAYGMATDSTGTIYLTGATGVTGSSGNSFLAKHTTSGSQTALQALPINGSEVGASVAVDAAGNYYVAGAYNISNTGSDAFVAKYDATGRSLWFTPIATTVVGVPAADAASGIALDSAGNVYITGFTQASAFVGYQGNAFVAKLNGSTGSFINQFGGDGIVEYNGTQNKADAAAKVAVDSNGNVYITGITNATLSPLIPNNPFQGGNAFIASYDRSGSLRWQNTLDSDAAVQDYGRDIVVSGDAVYITGQTATALAGNVHKGGTDAFVAKYSTGGSRQWVKQFGTTGREEAQGIAVDSAGRVYLTGETNQSLFGSYYGGSDSWLAVYDGNGNAIKGLQFGTLYDDEAYSIAVNGSSIYIAGQTEGAFPGFANQGSYDAWVAQYDINLV